MSVSGQSGQPPLPGTDGPLGVGVPAPRPKPPPNVIEAQEAVDRLYSAWETMCKVFGEETAAAIVRKLLAAVTPPKRSRGRPSGANRYDNEALLVLYDRLRAHPDLLNVSSSRVQWLAARLEFHFQGSKAGNSELAIKRRLERALEARIKDRRRRSGRISELARAAGYPSALAWLAAMPRGPERGLLNQDDEH